MRFGVRHRYDLRTCVYDALLLPGLVLCGQCVTVTVGWPEFVPCGALPL